MLTVCQHVINPGVHVVHVSHEHRGIVSLYTTSAAEMQACLPVGMDHRMLIAQHRGRTRCMDSCLKEAKVRQTT
jgi:hypothetical protein